MLSRVAVVACACILAAASAMAEELGPEQAKAFVVGKLFAYTCFDGTAGMGRIFADGSVVGTIRPGGRGEVRFASLPPGTIKVEGTSMCAHLSGMPLQPCFRVEKIDYRSFRGSVAGLGFAYCDFSQHNARAQIISRAPEPRTRITSRMPAPAPAPVQAAPRIPEPSLAEPSAVAWPDLPPSVIFDAAPQMAEAAPNTAARPSYKPGGGLGPGGGRSLERLDQFPISRA